MNRWTEAVNQGNLGLAYADLGDLRKAIEYGEPVLTIACEIGDWRGEGIVLFNMSPQSWRGAGENDVQC